ncbi:hypothetical protein ACVUJJ_000421 [Cronobacter turicensis]|uniref:hypothetical protein n=1 Tax=Cronobacter turicensis TaxID=413502 RepID=UPI0024AE8C65|nr:hypothetical protein [Cronobacter turicensis]MDI7404435.1 hypothetical protein [Cronobacter turicensis]
MAVNYQRKRSSAERLLRGYGTTWKITRPGEVEVIAGEEHVRPETHFDAVGVRSDYKPAEVDGTLIIGGDVQIVFTADQELLVGDLVDIDGTQYRIVNPNPVKPADLLICYRAQLRA